ncbi:MAG: hypothetical protein WCH07_09470 [Deltaproteobacteria bacterium]
MKAKKEQIVIHVKGIFNTLMIVGAVSGYLIFSGVGQLQDAWRHTGERHEYTTGMVMLGIGLVVWVLFARNAENNAREKDRQLETDERR